MQITNQEKARLFRTARELSKKYPAKYVWIKRGINGRTEQMGLIDTETSSTFYRHYVYKADFSDLHRSV